jgi:hypothetical protein
LKEVAPTDEQPKQRSTDRIQHEPRLIREKSYQQAGEADGKPYVTAQRAQVAACVDAGARRHDGGESRQ